MPSGSIIIKPKTEDEQDRTKEFETGDVVIIGRKAPDDQPSILLEYPDVSSKHAKLRCLAQYWTITDLGSTNGTRLNGEPVRPGSLYRLESGDRINIADCELVVSSCPLYDGPEPEQNLRERLYNIHGLQEPGDPFQINSRLVPS
jgi:pSer/pThr/pTyr-binding forkhead associated (FHA) protein